MLRACCDPVHLGLDLLSGQGLAPYGLERSLGAE